MEIKDEALLEEFRDRRRCDVCRRPVLRCQPHHILRRGMGGGSRLDVRLNLVACCFACHWAAHQGIISRQTLLATVAEREHVPEEKILAELYALARQSRKAFA